MLFLEVLLVWRSLRIIGRRVVLRRRGHEDRLLQLRVVLRRWARKFLLTLDFEFPQNDFEFVLDVLEFRLGFQKAFEFGDLFFQACCFLLEGVDFGGFGFFCVRFFESGGGHWISLLNQMIDFLLEVEETVLGVKPKGRIVIFGSSADGPGSGGLEPFVGGRFVEQAFAHL